MSINEVINEYATMNDEEKERYISEVLIGDYIPYERKITMCEKVIRSTMYSKIDGRETFYANTPAQKMMYSLLLINEYFNINIPYTLEAFNALNKVDFPTFGSPTTPNFILNTPIIVIA